MWVGADSCKQIREAVLTSFQLSSHTYGLNQLRYDLRKLKGHGLLERDGSRYAYRLDQGSARGRDQRSPRHQSLLRPDTRATLPAARSSRRTAAIRRSIGYSSTCMSGEFNKTDYIGSAARFQ